MSRLEILTPDHAQTTVENLYRDLERRIVASPPGLCPVDMAASFLKFCRAQTCGKCVPCRVGLAQLEILLEDVLNQRADIKTLDLIERTARVVSASADCAIGWEAANMVLQGVKGFRDDYVEHITHGRCTCGLDQPVPCVALCPAGVDIPGYVALVKAGRYADAVRLIRNDNPFPTACGFVCEHPCEARCRRNMVDASVNIRGLKRFAVDHAGKVPAPVCAPATGKRVAVVGGGPGGLSAAYYLSLMGHSVTIYEKQPHLGGMLRYGIPSYRLPRERLQDDIDVILSTGIQVQTDVAIGENQSVKDLAKEYDAVFLAIGAHANRALGIEGEDSQGVVSAVAMLRDIGNEKYPDFHGKKVVVIGGGNVAMDAARSAFRLGAKAVDIVYRRRQDDMTAQQEEIVGAVGEGCEVLELQVPVRIEADADGHVAALWVQPQIIGKIDAGGRPRPADAKMEEKRIACDLIVVAVGQRIDYRPFEECGVPVHKGTIQANTTGRVAAIQETAGLFAGGDCVSGPSTVVKAIAAGKVAAANIDNYLGFNHEIVSDVEIPSACLDDRLPCGRVNMTEREAAKRKNDFDLMENGMTAQEAAQESSRCLRCDHFGFGVFKGGRRVKW
ncbi:MAG: NAD(P)-binding protein [Ethanoligenens sp.]